MAKKQPKEGPERFKLDTDWQTAARKLLNTPAGSVPPRQVKARKKKAKVKP
jgi:hypothetical protein